MKLFKSQIKRLIEKKNFEAFRQLLKKNPSLANQGITIPFDSLCTTKAHPLHRICDGVIKGKITDEEAVKFAEILLDNGANIDGEKVTGGGTPLLAAASLHAEKVAILYIEKGADIHYTFKNDGVTALHWAAFCGCDKLVERLLKENPEIDLEDKTYKSTPLGWAIHCLMSGDKMNTHNQLKCIKLLLKKGAAVNALGNEKKEYLDLLAKKDSELQKLLY